MTSSYRFLFLFLFFGLSHGNHGSSGQPNCPERCACALQTMVCTGREHTKVPRGFPLTTTRIELQQNYITRISKDDFSNLTSLKYLDLSNNAIEHIDENAFEDLVNLERIRLDKNKLRQLPDYLFRRMEKLNRLDLSNNELEVITNAQIMGSKSMLNFKADKNKLSCIETDVLREWKSLEILTLSNNRLSTLDALEALPNIRIFRIFDNPWLCDCRMKWLRRVVNASQIANVKCHRPFYLQGQSLLQIDEGDMKCSGIEKRATSSCSTSDRCPAECACTATVADCHDRSLTHVPLHFPPAIEEIRLNGNKITSIPSKAFSKLANLRTLDFSRNMINSIAPDAFAGLKKLQHLQLFHNNLTILHPSVFDKLYDLEVLMLNANNLRCIPRDLFKDLFNLSILSIYKNQIKSIENGTFGSLKSISSLQISENPYICDCNLGWLVDFLAEKVLLDRSSISCAGPKRMTNVKFSKRSIVEKFKCKGSEYLITKNAGQCLIDHPCPPQCMCFGTIVDCSNRNLNSIPENLPGFTTTLLLNKNHITEVLADNTFDYFPNLEKLDMSNNNITHIESQAFGRLRRLKEIVLNNNQLRYFDSEIFGNGISGIERLHLSSNKLECISPATFKNMQNLTLLSLADNQIRSIAEDAFVSLSHLHTLYFGGNRLECNCDLFPLLNFFDRHSKTKILDTVLCYGPEEFKDQPVSSLRRETSTCQSSNPRQRICTEQGSYCPYGCTCEGTVVRCSHAGLNEFPPSLPAETTELYLNGNNISEIRLDVLNQLVHLVRLDLSNNALHVLENNTFTALQKLDVLILNFNELQCLEDNAFNGLTNLRILSMHGNNLSELPEQAFTQIRKTIQQIAMLNNSFYCDCQLAWFNRWIRQSYVESGLSKCSEPKHMADQLILTANPSQFTCKEAKPHHVLSKCNPCVSSPCQNNGICETGLKRSYNCRCAVGYYGKHCEREIDACYGEPCANAGKCEVVEEGRFQCFCKKGFTGQRCEHNINDCVGNKCKNGGVCVDGVNSYHCDCPPLYAGKFCEEKIKYCHTGYNPCRNGAKCEPLGENDYKCHCTPGFAGQNCTVLIDNCAPDSCNNNGVCVSTSTGFTCQCAEGFVGEFCEIPLPSALFYHSRQTCNEDTCKHGSCSRNEDDEIDCKCHFGFEGPSCALQSTIGFETPKSYASVFGFNSASKGNISFSIRTNNPDGIILYYGDESQFISAELFDGRIRLAISIGRNPLSLMYSYIKINDGKQHAIHFKIDGNQAYLKIDNMQPQTIVNKGHSKQLELKTKQPVYIGGLPEEVALVAVNEFRVKQARSLHGCVADFYISGHKVDFADDTVVKKLNTQSGCGPSIDVCQDVSCNDAGKCIRNDSQSIGYQCDCKPSYAGANCERREPSCTKERYRAYYEENGCRSVDVIKNARCNGWCGNADTEPSIQPDGSTYGPGCCCKAVKKRQRKVRMICPNGSQKYTLVPIIRKCICSNCSDIMLARH